jgi:hypothetical protein
MQNTNRMSGDRIVSCNLRPPHSHNITLCNLFFVRIVKKYSISNQPTDGKTQKNCSSWRVSHTKNNNMQDCIHSEGVGNVPESMVITFIIPSNTDKWTSLYNVAANSHCSWLTRKCSIQCSDLCAGAQLPNIFSTQQKSNTSLNKNI